MFVSFVRHCMLFKTKDKLFWFFGVFAWIDLFVLIYALTKIFTIE